MTKRVLIVEDEILVALDLEEFLIEAGYDVTGIAADRREALALASDADVALVDLNLRDGPTGISIGLDLSAKGIRVLFLTANPSSVAGDVPGAVGCLGKPCPPSAVCEAINFATAQGKPARAPGELKLFH